LAFSLLGRSGEKGRGLERSWGRKERRDSTFGGENAGGGDREGRTTQTGEKRTAEKGKGAKLEQVFAQN